jgi:hypothetical protein
VAEGGTTYSITDANQAVDFDDVLAVGLYFEASGSWSGVAGEPNSLNSHWAMDDFQVNVIPEPATLAMIGVGGVVALLVRRFRI